MSFSKVFEHIGNSDTGQELLTKYLLFFMNQRNVSLFQSSGKIQDFSQF